MAMTKCKECGAEISDKAQACPKCGARPPKRTSRWTWLVGGLMLMVLLRCTWDVEKAKDAKAAAQAQAAASQAAAEAAMTPAQRASAAAAREAASAAAALKERKWQAWLALATPAVGTLKAAAKDPGSFRLEQAVGSGHWASMCRAMSSPISLGIPVRLCFDRFLSWLTWLYERSMRSANGPTPPAASMRRRRFACRMPDIVCTLLI